MADAVEISCVVPTFGRPDLVGACLDSVRAQARVRYEVIVSDDTPGDEIRALARDRAATDPQLRYVEGARSGNPVDNWNHGLGLARAPLRLVIHQDEWLIGEAYLRDAVDALDDPAVAAALGRAVVRGGERPSRFNRVAPVARRLPRAAWFLPMVNWVGPTAAFVFRAPHRFDARLVQLVDVEFYGRVLGTGALARLAGERVGSRGYHGGQITASIDPIGLALAELDALKARRPPGLGPVQHRLARLAVEARRWTR